MYEIRIYNIFDYNWVIKFIGFGKEIVNNGDCYRLCEVLLMNRESMMIW